MAKDLLAAVLCLSAFICDDCKGLASNERNAWKDKKIEFNFKFDIGADPQKSVYQQRSKYRSNESVDHGASPTLGPQKRNNIYQQPSRLRSDKEESVDHGAATSTLYDGYVFYNKASGSFKLYQTKMPWTEARVRCYQDGAELASPETEAMLHTLTTIMVTSSPPPSRIFTGINDLYAKGYFNSIRGTVLENMPAKWAPEEPYKVASDNCITMNPNGLLHNSKCTVSEEFVCYRRDASILNAVTVCGKVTGYKYYDKTNSCYKIYESQPFDVAYATCARDGALILTPTDDADGDVRWNLFKNRDKLFLGATSWAPQIYFTINGVSLQELGISIYGDVENNKHKCLYLSSVGKVCAGDCNTARRFICKKKPVWNN